MWIQQRCRFALCLCVCITSPSVKRTQLLMTCRETDRAELHPFTVIVWFCTTLPKLLNTDIKQDVCRYTLTSNAFTHYPSIKNTFWSIVRGPNTAHFGAERSKSFFFFSHCVTYCCNVPVLFCGLPGGSELHDSVVLNTLWVFIAIWLRMLTLLQQQQTQSSQHPFKSGPASDAWGCQISILLLHPNCAVLIINYNRKPYFTMTDWVHCSTL